MSDTNDLDDEALIDRLDAGLPARSPEEAMAREPYERLFARIRDLEDFEPPAGWEERLGAMRQRERRRHRRRIYAGAVLLAIGAMAALYLLC